LQKLLPTLTLATISALLSNAQDKSAVIKNAIERKNYVFIAQAAQPTSGRQRQLTSEYELEVNGDTINADLPYFGRAYTVPVDPSKGGINFTTTNFEYTNTPGKKGGCTILIKPRENVDARQLILTVTTSGFATLQVISNSRQSISYSGYVEQGKPK
jgi:hypothetical protein